MALSQAVLDAAAAHNAAFARSWSPRGSRRRDATLYVGLHKLATSEIPDPLGPINWRLVVTTDEPTALLMYSLMSDSWIPHSMSSLLTLSKVPWGAHTGWQADVIESLVPAMPFVLAFADTVSLKEDEQ